MHLGHKWNPSSVQMFGAQVEIPFLGQVRPSGPYPAISVVVGFKSKAVTDHSQSAAEHQKSETLLDEASKFK